MGNKIAAPPNERTDLLQQGLVKIDLVDGNRLLPRIHIDNKLFEGLCDPWREALIVKVLGKKVGFKIMQSKLPHIWRLAGGFDLMDVDNGFFMVKFDLPEDREKVIEGGPWLLFDHYLAVSTWSPDFVSSTAKIEKTMVWIRFPGMNLVFYDENILMAMASAVGRPIKVDQRTLSVDRGRFARVCVEINLNQPVVAQVWVRGTWHKVAYEGLHILCGACGCYGHVTRNCTTTPPVLTTATPLTAAPQQVAVSEIGKNSSNQEVPIISPTNNDDTEKPEIIHGDWIAVERKKKSNKGGVHKNNKSATVKSQGNKFEVFNKVTPNSQATNQRQESQKNGTSDPSIGGYQSAPKVWIRKRQRVHNVVPSHEGPSTALASSSATLTPTFFVPVQRNNNGTNHHTGTVQIKEKTKGPQMFQLENGAKSTVNLHHVAANDYVMYADDTTSTTPTLNSQLANQVGLGGPGGPVINTLAENNTHVPGMENAIAAHDSHNADMLSQQLTMAEADVAMEAT